MSEMEGDIHIDDELRRRKRNNNRLRKEEEERRLIADGEGPRKAKALALKNASWYEAEGKKRPRSPSADDDNAGSDQHRQSNKEKPRKRLQKRSDDEGEQIAVRDKREKVKTSRKRSKSTTRKVAVSKTRTTTIKSDADESSSLPSLSGSDDDHAKSNRSDDEDGDGSDALGGDEDHDDFDASKITEREARKLLDGEMPMDATTLFDDNNVDVEMASVKSRRSRSRSSSEASRPPTSESEGLFDDQGSSSGEDEVDDDDNPPARVSQKSKKSKSTQRVSKRDAALRSERPTTLAASSSDKKSKKRTSTVKVESDEDKTTPEETWPKALQLRHGALTQQTDLIRALCRDGIRIVETTLVTQHAWPELHKGAPYKRQVLLDAVKSLRAKNTEDDEGKQEKYYKALHTRIARDDKFVKLIGKWVVDRLSHHRGQVRSTASDHIAIFQLGVGTVCAQRVQALIENDLYVYPGQWATDKDGKPVWMAKTSATDVQIYHNPGLIDVIKTSFFNGPTAFGYKFKKHYVSSHSEHKEPELTIPIVALAATAYFAALYEWREGRKAKTSSDSQRAKAEKFEGDNFKKVYDRHMDTLLKLKKKVNAYHQVMSGLYSKVVDGNNQADTGALVKGSALAVLDLDGLD